MEKVMNVNECPYCGSPNVEFMGENDMYGERQWHCHECDRWYNGEDFYREVMRHKISALLNGTSEEEPKVVEVIIGEEDACGLSSLELPCITEMFELEGDGTIWYHIDGGIDFNGEKLWEDIDRLTTKELEDVLEYLLEN